jgi:CHAT domain-containing protein
LVEKHDIAVVPSAATFLQLRIRTSRSTREPSVLAVAGPPSAPLLSLRHLQRVDEECQQISRFYPRPRLLSGELATKDSFLNLAPSYSVIHFAGHAMANMARPDLSMLVFAPGGRDDDSGYLYSHELASVDLSKARVVVLAACSTAAGRTFGSEGVFSLARSFLAAGASTVVASLWPVGDESTAHLLITFHRELQSGVGPAAALRAAQLNLLRSSDRLVQSPVSWSGFQVYGVP